jgi:hypothetical protein
MERVARAPRWPSRSGSIEGIVMEVAGDKYQRGVWEFRARRRSRGRGAAGSAKIFLPPRDTKEKCARTGVSAPQLRTLGVCACRRSYRFVAEKDSALGQFLATAGSPSTGSGQAFDCVRRLPHSAQGDGDFAILRAGVSAFMACMTSTVRGRKGACVGGTATALGVLRLRSAFASLRSG